MNHASSRRHLLPTAILAASLCGAAIPSLAKGQTLTPLDRAVHIANRCGYGPSPQTTTAILGASSTKADAIAYINAQLNAPTGLLDFGYGLTNIVNSVASLPVPLAQNGLNPPALMAGIADIGQVQLAIATYSEFQLREVVANFWDRHFNTFLFGKQFYFSANDESPTLPAVGPDQATHLAAFFEFEAANTYRSGSFASFAAILQFMARHPSMVIYLSLPSNVVANPGDVPNEDFARELFELHTMGPERQQLDAAGMPFGPIIKNYNQQDIIEAARIFSGWTVRRDTNSASPTFGDFRFVFDDTLHDQGTKNLFVGTAAPFSTGPNGVQEGLDLLAHLANNMEATRQFMCTKLVREFLGDDADSTANGAQLVKDAMTAWTNNGGSMKEVLRTILTSDAFLDDPAFRRVRARPPFKTVCAPLRALEATAAAPATTPYLGPIYGLYGTMLLMGNELFAYPAPDGYPSESDEQISSSAAVQRMIYAHNVLRTPAFFLGVKIVPDIDLVPLFNAQSGANDAAKGWNFAGELLTRMHGPSGFTLDDHSVVSNTFIDVKTTPEGQLDLVAIYSAATMAASLTQSGIE